MTAGAKEQDQGRGTVGLRIRTATWLGWSTRGPSVVMMVLGVLFLVLLTHFPHSVLIMD